MFINIEHTDLLNKCQIFCSIVNNVYFIEQVRKMNKIKLIDPISLF